MLKIDAGFIKGLRWFSFLIFRTPFSKFISIVGWNGPSEVFLKTDRASREAPVRRLWYILWELGLISEHLYLTGGVG